jgi:uncharacterized protein
VLYLEESMSDAITEESRRVALEFFAALNRADSKAVGNLYADDGYLWTAGTMPISGTFTKAQAMQGMEAILSYFPEGITFTIKGMTVEGERVAIEAESHGRHISGKPYHNQYHFLMIVRGGKVAAFKEYLDTQHAYEVLVASASRA